MAEMTNLGFRGSPIMVSELVKFLALNTGFEVIEKLLKSNIPLKADVAEIRNTVTGNTKTITTATNRVDNYKTNIDNIKQRLAKLDEKNDPSVRLKLPHTSLRSHFLQVMT